VSISVVIPTYNRRHIVGEAIDSALAQDGPAAEVLVVDDGSTDGTGAMLARRYGSEPRVRVIHRTNGGPPAARNTGVARARFEYVALLDSDDVWCPGYLTSQLEVIRAADADLVIANGVMEDQDGDGVLLFDHPEWVLPDSVAAMCTGTWILPSFTVLRRAVAAKLGFDELFRMCDDTEFMFRFTAAGYRCVGNPRALARYRALWARPAPGGPPAASRPGARQLCTDRDTLLLAVYRVWQHHAAAYPEVLSRGPDFDRQFGELLLRHGRPADAYPHLLRLWRARRYVPSTNLLLLRAAAGRAGARRGR
jgi:glycosyltransferase involved in cell wall biosynthesis